MITKILYWQSLQYIYIYFFFYYYFFFTKGSIFVSRTSQNHRHMPIGPPEPRPDLIIIIINIIKDVTALDTFS